MSRAALLWPSVTVVFIYSTCHIYSLYHRFYFADSGTMFCVVTFSLLTRSSPLGWTLSRSTTDKDCGSRNDGNRPTAAALLAVRHEGLVIKKMGSCSYQVPTCSFLVLA